MIRKFYLLKTQEFYGYCRIMFSFKIENRKYIVCLQDEGENYGGISFYRCTDDGEPDVKLKVDKNYHFEKVNLGYDLELEAKVNNWIAEKANFINERRDD